MEHSNDFFYMFENKMYLITSGHVAFVRDVNEKDDDKKLKPMRRLYMMLDKKANP